MRIFPKSKIALVLTADLSLVIDVVIVEGKLIVPL
jgi:hypothetical protein